MQSIQYCNTLLYVVNSNHKYYPFWARTQIFNPKLSGPDHKPKIVIFPTTADKTKTRERTSHQHPKRKLTYLHLTNIIMLPSDVAAEISANPPRTSEEAEGLVQRVLSLLATLEPPEAIISSSQIWECLSNNDHVVLDSVSLRGFSNEEWQNGLKILGNLLRQYDSLLSPFEIHNVAIQASVFCETQQVELYSTTCILLCCHALFKCPPRVTSRPKRWRSSLFETVRLCQRHVDFLDIATLVKHVIPACVHVRNALPEGTDTLHWIAAFQSSVVQMTSHLALKLVKGKDPNGRPESMAYLCQGVEHALGGNFETLLHARYFANEELKTPPISNAKRIKLWLSGMAEEEEYEALASVETEVDEAGLAELSCFWFDWSGRPQIFSGSHLWHLLFPSVSILLNMNECIDSQLHGFVLLQHLLSLVPPASLATPSPKRPNNPQGTFQLLSNRIVADAASKQDGSSSISLLPNGAQAFQLMKGLLAKYQPRDQVRIVRQLHEQCPHQGLKPKIVDLFRDIVNWNDSKALAMAWSFLQSRIQSLEEDYVVVRSNRDDDDGSSSHATIANPQNLIMEAEDFVAVIGLLRLWYMIRKTPTGVPNLETRLSIVQQAVVHAMSTHHQSSLDIFRLGLLESAIQLLLDSPDKGTMED